MIVLLVLLLYLILDTCYLNHQRRKIKYVIHVNGIRGKSSVVKHLDDIFRAAGFRTYSKITGTTPYIIDTDHNKKIIKRSGLANIIEQKRYLVKAAKAGAQVYIVECMALKLESQMISEQFLKSDIGIITNVRTDHLEVMGYTHKKIGNHLKGMRPKKGVLIVGNENLMDSNTILGVTDLQMPSLHQENLGVVLKTLEVLKLDQSLIKHIQPIERKKWLAYENIQVMNAFTANDLETTQMMFETYKAMVEQPVLWYNNRKDRPIRKALFIAWLNTLKDVKIYITGDEVKHIQSQLKHPIIRLFDQNMKVFGFGNIKGLEVFLDEEL